MKTEIKLCVECKHYEPPLTGETKSGFCANDEAIFIDPVKGKRTFTIFRCIDRRTSPHNLCGPEGKLWEKK